MLKKILVLGLCVLTMNLFLSASAFAETKEEKAAKLAGKVKTKIAKLGTGQDARVEVKLKDGRKVKGYVSGVDDNSFTIVNEKTGISTEVLYSEPKQVRGNNLSTGAKIAIGVAIGIGVAILLAYLGNNLDDSP